MAQVLKQLHPAGWTSRRTYGLAVLFGAAALVAMTVIFSLADIPLWTIALVGALAFVALALLTIRRLRDAGVSVWIALLLFFPFGISIDMGTVTVSGLALHFVDLGALIRAIPVLLGLVLRSQPVEKRVL